MFVFLFLFCPFSIYKLNSIIAKSTVRNYTVCISECSLDQEELLMLLCKHLHCTLISFNLSWSTFHTHSFMGIYIHIWRLRECRGITYDATKVTNATIKGNFSLMMDHAISTKNVTVNISLVHCITSDHIFTRTIRESQIKRIAVLNNW